MLLRTVSICSTLFPLILGIIAAVNPTIHGLPASPAVTITNTHPMIFYEGRWDRSPGTWWPGSGFKLTVKNLKSLVLNLGSLTSSPTVIAVSIGDTDFFAYNASSGANIVPLDPLPAAKTTTIRINVQAHFSNRMILDSIVLNPGASIVPYKPKSKVVFQFIGDSFSSGYLLPMGINQAWTFLVGQKYNAEYRVTAQPGAALTNISSYGNVNGMSYQFFRTEDTGFYYTTDHNYTTPWSFARDQPPPTHVVIHIGANDAAQGVTNDTFLQVYNDFLEKIRKLYPKQPFFMLTPWGWPTESGYISYYYQGLYQQVLEGRNANGDKNIFLVDATGWVTYSDVMPDNLHPNIEGQIKISDNFLSFLESWGLSPPK